MNGTQIRQNFTTDPKMVSTQTQKRVTQDLDKLHGGAYYPKWIIPSLKLFSFLPIFWKLANKNNTSGSEVAVAKSKSGGKHLCTLSRVNCLQRSAKITGYLDPQISHTWANNQLLSETALRSWEISADYFSHIRSLAIQDFLVPFRLCELPENGPYK